MKVKIKILFAVLATVSVVLAGVKTDTMYCSGGLRGLRLYSPQADIDSMVGDVKIGGKLGLWDDLTINNLNGQIILPNGYLRINVGGADRMHIRPGAVSIFGPCSTTTINTGNGDCEVYPMNQDVMSTASPTFVNVDATTGTFSGAVQGETFNSGLGATEIPLYTSGSFTMTLYENSTNRASGTAYWQRIGSVVTLLIPQLISTLSGSDVTLTGLPTEILPYANQNFTKMLYGSDAIISGTMSLFYNSNYIDVNKMDGSDLSAGNSGIPGGTSITYFAN